MPQDEFAGVCLLGLDFLKLYKAVIDLVNGTLTLEINGKKVTTKLIESTVGAMLLSHFVEHQTAGCNSEWRWNGGGNEVVVFVIFKGSEKRYMRRVSHPKNLSPRVPFSPKIRC